MKKIKSVLFVTLLLLLSMLVLFGCTKEATTAPTEFPNVTPTDAPTEAQTTQAAAIAVEYETIAFETLDAGIQNELDLLKQNEGYYIWEDALNGTTMYIGMGLKPTGGFGMTVETVEMLDGVMHVSVLANTPAPDAMVTQALTYPFVILKFKTDVTPDAVIVTNQDGIAYTERALDYENQLVVEGTYVGQIDNNSIEVSVGEGFMVFRNFLMSEIVVGFEEGAPVTITYTETEEGQFQLIQMDRME